MSATIEAPRLSRTRRRHKEKHYVCVCTPEKGLCGTEVLGHGSTSGKVTCTMCAELAERIQMGKARCPYCNR